MGIYDREYYRDNEPEGFQISSQRSVVTTLILANVAVYIANLFLFSGEPVVIDNVRTVNDLNHWFAAKPGTLINPLFWWQFVTYGFAHDRGNIMHIAGNMLGLFIFGRELEARYGKKEFLAFYLTALVLGSVGWSAVELATSGPGALGALIGASGAVTAVIILFALTYPRRTVLFMMVIPMPAWVFGLFIVVYNILNVPSIQEQQIAFDVHLIGAAYGFLFFKTGWDFSRLLPANFSFKSFRPGPRLRVHNPENRQADLNRQADQVLEKLHRSGEESLSTKERQILERYSRQMRQKHR